MSAQHHQIQERIAIIGLGYIGLPLAVHFAKHYPTTGYDLDPERIDTLSRNIDSNNQFSEELTTLTPSNLTFSNTLESIRTHTVYIVAVPTPLRDGIPDLDTLKQACRDVGGVLDRDDLVVIESTVYPGATEDVCIPILEKSSGLSAETDFHCGYSPERVRPASQWKDPSEIVKLTSGHTEAALIRIDKLYGRIIQAGTMRVSNIKIAEMSKIVENIQRDVNIALCNELAMACATLNIPANEVFEAADSKWDYHRFKPGLVGGHCISVDPVYLSHQMRKLGFVPEMVELARRINDGMSHYISTKAVELLNQNKTKKASKARILIMGFSFKENCSDHRNTMVAAIVTQLRAQDAHVCVCDPICDALSVQQIYSIDIVTSPDAVLSEQWDVIIFAVAHDVFKGISEKQLGKAIIMDIHNIAARADWRL